MSTLNWRKPQKALTNMLVERANLSKMFISRCSSDNPLRPVNQDILSKTTLRN